MCLRSCSEVILQSVVFKGNVPLAESVQSGRQQCVSSLFCLSDCHFDSPCLSQQLSLSFSLQQASSGNDPLVTPLAGWFRGQRAIVVQGLGSQDSMVLIHPRLGLYVLGVAVVTTLPHKLHQPAIRLALQCHPQIQTKRQLFCLFVTVTSNEFRL